MTMADDAAARIRGWLHDGTIGRDRFHSVPQMADRLGMSRSPVREGLLRLAEAGLVEFVPQRGFRPVRPTGQDIAEIFALRLALEPQAAARAAREQSPDVIDALRADLTAMRTATSDATFEAADERLHATILGCARNGRLTDLIGELRDTTRLLGARTTDRSRTRDQIVAEHRPIVDAIADRDPVAAADRMRAHLLVTGRLLVEQARDDGDPDAPEAWQRTVEDATDQDATSARRG